MKLHILLSSLIVAQSGWAGVALFSRPTDTIRVDDNTIPIGGAATYEARILFTPQYAGFGFVFNEFIFGGEDKQLLVGPNGANSTGFSFRAFSAGLTTETPFEISVSIPISSNIWHHIAYVYDGLQERLYLDGALVRSRGASGDVWDSTGYGSVGSVYRENSGGRRPGFVGYIDTLRISTFARYSGAKFEPPQGDLASDNHTVLLYNFNESPGSTLAFDESPLRRTGRLGIPPTLSSTAPQFTFDPIPVLKLSRSPSGWILTWDGPFVLQSSSSADGEYTDVANASMPFVLDAGAASQQFFRLR